MLVLKNATIASGQIFLIANYPADHEKSQIAIQPQYVDPAISLPNIKLLVRLYGGDLQNGATPIDLADDDRGAPFAGDSALELAMVRTAFDQRGDQRQSWARRPRNKVAGTLPPMPKELPVRSQPTCSPGKAAGAH